MTSKVHFSSKSSEWATPQYLFDELNERFSFELDVCATSENAKCERFYSPDQDGLSQPWAPFTCWCNPPYGREIRHWVQKAKESAELGAQVVCLIPARTDTSYWHDFIFPFAHVEFLRGRIKFGDAKHGAPFPSAVVVFRPCDYDAMMERTIQRKRIGLPVGAGV